MARDRTLLYPNSLSAKDPANRETLKARQSEYQAIMQFFNRVSTRNSYLQANLITRLEMLKKETAVLLENRRRAGKTMCGVNVQEMIKRHMKREAHLRQMRRQGYETRRGRLRAASSAAQNDDEDADSDHDENDNDEPAQNKPKAPTATMGLNPTDDRLQLLENTVTQIHPYIAHVPNLGAALNNLQNEVNRLNLDYQFLARKVNTHDEGLTALVHHAAETDNWMKRFSKRLLAWGGRGRADEQTGATKGEEECG